MLSQLEVQQNKIINKKGEEIILHGASINEPYTLLVQEKHDFLEDIKQIKEFGFNTVRIPISPAYWQSRNNYIEKVLDPIVLLCKEIELYCILDWHAQGNPLTGETRRPDLLVEGFMKYDSRIELAEKVLVGLTQRYSKEYHVLFEIFAMPNVISGEDWSRAASSFAKKIRENSEAPLIINAVKWSSDLYWTLKNPIEEKNIVYGIMIYKNSSENMNNIFKMCKEVKKKYPIIITERGFIEESDNKEFVGTKDSYAIPLKNFVISNNLSWVAWIWHPFGYTSKASTLINGWDPKNLTSWGRFVKEELL